MFSSVDNVTASAVPSGGIRGGRPRAVKQWICRRAASLGLHAKSDRETVRDVVQQLLHSPRAKRRASDVQWRLAVEQRMRPIQKTAGLILVDPNGFRKCHHSRQALGSLALV